MSAELQLYPDHDEDYNLCVKVGSQTFTEAQALGAAYPSLLEDAQKSPRLTNQLAAALVHLRGHGGELVHDVDAALAEIQAWAEPGLVQVPTWDREWSVAGPARDELHPPSWETGRLAFCAYRTDWGHKTKHVFAERLVLDPESWELEWTSIEGSCRPLAETQAAAEAAFGAAVAGFFTVQLPSYSWVLIGVGEGLTQRCAWVEKQASAPLGFADYAAFADAHPEARDPKAIASLASQLAHFYSDDEDGFQNLQVIPDGPAYVAEYRQNNYETFKLRYWGDQIRETSCHVPDLETVASPALEGNLLRAYFKGDKYQPFRLEVDLSSLTLTSPTPPKAMATQTQVSDGPEGLSLLRRPGPPPRPTPSLQALESPPEVPPPPPKLEGGYPLKGG